MSVLKPFLLSTLLLPVIGAIAVSQAVADGRAVDPISNQISNQISGRIPGSVPSPIQIVGDGVTGNLLRIENFPSDEVAARHIDIWLPPGYEDNSNKRYPVVYMHDGQNLFDPSSTPYGEWGVDEAMTRLIDDGVVRPAIIVGVWNSPKRFQEYMPRKALEKPNVETGVDRYGPFSVEDIISDRYLKFLVNELKPFIDDHYRTRTSRQDTFAMGSSMGGLISAYALSEYPDVFSGAGCVSTHWPAGEGAVIDYLAANLPDAGTHKLYFDFGTETLDAQYEPFQIRADAVMEAKGYQQGKDWITRKFEGDPHNEIAWRGRVHVPLTFLLSDNDD
ncbi:MAG: alpha/beta hydrolase-fold protein [Pseudomonadota bacterium]